MENLKYAGFWKRFCANFIDALIFIPFTFLIAFLSSHSKYLFILLQITYCFLAYGYYIYFLNRWGKTLGKMAVKIRVVQLNGEALELKHALLRYCVDMMFAVLIMLGYVIAISNIPEEKWVTIPWIEQSKEISKLQPVFFNWVTCLSIVWTYSELIVLLFNKKKRALHDFIAGTVVVREESLPA